MKVNCIKHWFLAAAAMLAAAGAGAQTATVMQNGTEMEVQAYGCSTGTIVDDGGTDGAYSTDFDGSVILRWQAGLELHIGGDYSIENGYDYLSVLENGVEMYRATGTGTMDFTSTSGTVVLRFYSDYIVTYDGFELTWSLGSGTPCANPVTDLTWTDASSGAGTAVALNWNGSSTSYTVEVDGVLRGTTNSTSMTVSDLSPAQSHRATIYPTDEVNTCCAASIVFRTACGRITLPFAESFEDVTVGDLPPCWIRTANFDDAVTRPRVVGTAASDGQRSLMLSCGSTWQGGHFGLLATPPFEGTGEHTVTVDLMASHNGTVLIIGTMAESAVEYDTSTLVRLQTITLWDEGSWQSHTFSWNASEEGQRLVFMMKQSDQNGDGHMVYIDGGRVADCGIEGLSVTRMKDTMARLEWTTFGDPTCRVGVKHAGQIADETTVENATSPLTITGLDPETIYEFTVYASCGGVYNMAGRVNAMTEPTPAAAAGYCSDFGSNGYMWPEGWTLWNTGTSCTEVNSSNEGLRFYKGCGYDDGDSTTFVSPRLSGLAGKTVTVTVTAYPYGSRMLLGTVGDPDDPASFHAIDTLDFTSSFWNEIRYTVSYTVPASDTGNCVAMRFDCNGTAIEARVRAVSIDEGGSAITAHIAHARGTSVELRWDGIHDSVVIEYGYSGFTLGTGTRDTVLDTERATISGLNTDYSYDFYVYEAGHTPCGDMRLRAQTQFADHPMPYCEDFNQMDNPFWYDIRTVWSLDGLPGIMEHPYFYNAGHTLALASYGFEDQYKCILTLPDMEIDTGTVVSFYATSTTPTSRLVIGTMHYDDYDRFYPIDTVQISAGRSHYTVALPDSLPDAEGRLALTWFHPSEYSLQHLYIDELNIDTAAYSGLPYLFAGYDSASFGDPGLTRADSVRLTLIGGGDTLSYIWTPADGDLGVSGLDSGTLYLVYLSTMGDSGASCPSYTGYIITHIDGGEGMPVCNSFDALLSYELPAWWHFADSARIEGNVLVMTGMATMPPCGYPDGTSFMLRKLDNDTLIIGYTVDSVGFTPTDTVTSTTAEFYLHDIPDTAILALYAPDTVRIDQIGIFGCPIVDFQGEGGSMICTVRGDYEADYVVTLQAVGSSDERTVHITSSPYTIHNLQLGTTYQVSYYCMNNYTGCTPKVLVPIADSLTLPFCEQFGQVPQGWTFVYDDDVVPSIEMGWGGGPLRIGEWGRQNQMVILPAIDYSGAITIQTYGHIWDENAFEIGTVDASMDTSTFIPLTTNGRYTGWLNLTAGVDSIGDRRVALRSQSLVILQSIGILPQPRLKARLYSSRVLTLEADGYVPGDTMYAHYWDNYGYDSVMTIDSLPYELAVQNGVYYVYLQQVTDQYGNNCNAENARYDLSTAVDIPYCSMTNISGSGYRRYTNGYSEPTTTNQNGKYCWSMESFNNQGGHEYLVLPEATTTDISSMSIGFSYASQYVGDTIEVGVMTDAYDTSTFVPVGVAVYTDSTSYGWQVHTVSLASYTGAGRWIAFRHTGIPQTDYVWLTEFAISPCPGMANVTTASATHTRWNIVTVNAADTGFLVEYGITGFTPGEGTMERVDSLPYELTLAPKTAYDIYFRCDTGNLSCRPGVHIVTLDEPLELPVCVDFDTVAEGTMPSSWRCNLNAYVTATEYHDGGRSMAIPLGSYYGSYRYIVSPELNTVDITDYALSFWMYNDGCATVEVGTMTSPTDYNSFFSLMTCESPSDWNRFIVSLANSPSTARYIAIRAQSCDWGSSTLYLDNIGINACAAYNFRAQDVNFDNITLNWTQVGTPQMTVVVVKDSAVSQTIMPTEPPLTIYGLSPHSRYTFRFISTCPGDTSACSIVYTDSATLVTPADAADCVNPTDLNSPNSVFFSGNYYNPYSVAGAIDYGAESDLSRHTVCYDTAARDPRTGNLLRVVPEGYTSSVRLGNSSTNPYNPEAEGVIYSLFVDTVNFQLLLLHYAAVLQDPMHAPEDQPRFRLELLDSSFSPIDPDCSSADFVADQSLGWNTAADGVLWKDWTSVGIDLTDYADQQVYVRLTTYDCNEGSHYGYAYFTLECMRKALSTETCGNQATNTLTAPAGFNYRWYNSVSSETLSSEQSITIPTEDITYYCDLSKIDNAACMFTISAYGGTRYPMASFDTLVDINNCHFHVTFVNTSGVSKDNITPIAGEQCETAFWDYGNGQTSTSYHGSATYMMPGVYTVMLVSGIASDACQDTFYMTLNLELPDGMQPVDSLDAEICQGSSFSYYGGAYTQSGTYYASTPNPGLCDSLHILHLTAWPATVGDTIAEACDTMTWRTHFIDTTGVYTVPAGVPNSHGCDSTRALHVTIHYSIDTVIDDTITENQLPYPIAGTNLTMANFDTTGHPDRVGIHWVMHYTTVHGCDSTMDFRLTVWRNRDTALSATTCRNTLPYIFNGTPLNPTSDVQTYTFVVPTAHGADSTIVFTLSVVDNPIAYYADTIVENQLPHTFRGVSFDGPADTLFVFPSPACDTLAHYRLHVWPNLDTTLTRNICRDQLPYQFDSALFAEPTDIDSTIDFSDTVTILFADQHGADSTVTYIINVGGVFELADTIVICPNHPYIYHGVDYGGPTVVDVLLSTAHDCDSLVHVTLVPRDTNYRPQTFYRFDGQPWERPDSVLLGCAPTTLSLWDTTPGTISRQWLLATTDTVASSTDSLFSFNFPTSLNPTTAVAGLVIESNLGCIDTLAWPVLVFRSPRADFRWDPEVPVMSHPETQFINLSTLDSTRWSADSTYPLSYYWQIGSPSGDSDTSTLMNPYHSWGDGNEGITGDAEVTLTAYWEHTLDSISFGPYDSVTMASFALGNIILTCPDSLTQTVVISNDYLQFPNLVTPNGDGTNDTWVIVNLVEYGEYPTNELWIYNQWGALVYHVRDIRSEDQMWDPDKTNSPAGSYYYRFTARGRFGITKRNGLIEVVR